MIFISTAVLFLPQQTARSRNSTFRRVGTAESTVSDLLTSLRQRTYALPGPQAVGQVLGVQNSESALKNRLMFLKKATAGKKE